MAYRPHVLFFVLLTLLLTASHSPAAEPGDGQPQPDRYAVPDGGPAELVEFIREVLQTPPPNEQARDKALAALNEASDRVLAAEATDEQLAIVVELKLNLLRGQSKELQALADKLEAAGHDRLVRQVEGALLAADLQAAMRGPREEAVPAIGQAIEQIVQFLDEGPFAPSDVQLAMTAGQVAEMTGNDALAVGVYQKLGKLAAESDDPRLKALAESLEGVVRRLSLVGQPMEIEGKTLAGEPFDWSEYAGKTVLVSFWATWCGPCVREIPTLKRLYGAYREKGFEIVGISLDKDRGPLEDFVSERELPWTILHEDAGRNPVAEYYGIMGIPVMFLVGADGKVVSIQARGAALEELLEARFGPVPEQKEP